MEVMDQGAQGLQIGTQFSQHTRHRSSADCKLALGGGPENELTMGDSRRGGREKPGGPATWSSDLREQE
jgi:hypothetical protein